MPIAVVADVDTSTPKLSFLHTDHLDRPIMMTNSAKAPVWQAIWKPWGAPHSITGTVSLDMRFPGQWFQAESGLHYNWHRQYDPITGRYAQPDPLGFVDGASLYAYALSAPTQFTDFTGGQIGQIAGRIIQYCARQFGRLLGRGPRVPEPSPAQLEHFRRQLDLHGQIRLSDLDVR